MSIADLLKIKKINQKLDQGIRSSIRLQSNLKMAAKHTTSVGHLAALGCLCCYLRAATLDGLRRLARTVKTDAEITRMTCIRARSNDGAPSKRFFKDRRKNF